MSKLTQVQPNEELVEEYVTGIVQWAFELGQIRDKNKYEDWKRRLRNMIRKLLSKGIDLGEK